MKPVVLDIRSSYEAMEDYVDVGNREWGRKPLARSVPRSNGSKAAASVHCHEAALEDNGTSSGGPY